MAIKLSIIFFCMVIVSLYIMRTYRNLSSVEKENLKEELRNPVPLLLIALVYIGIMVLFMGLFLDFDVLKYIAFVLMGFGLVFIGAEEWKEDFKRGLLIVTAGSAVLLVTGLHCVGMFF
ncbi:hypothetical protein LS684_22880 (plasmid) [Cytobacillus spongiae]|uniref:hypothetical protein n=1 Tax=Cytobacillus spongiae TaxID=2901381 RepID=UPI001F28E758|nr:hypothetical protein [Cytobacillus spongiae]UII58442.1 hypothetical protein LS684_22880 [Cytobacillus spongiae]